MSTILETLKKLEEDKRLLEKDLDLKELVLREDQKLQVTVKISRKTFLISGLVLFTIIVIALIFFKQFPAENQLTYLPAMPSDQKLASLDSKGFESTVGIPLSNIPERRQLDKEKVSENTPPAIKPPVREFLQSVVEPEVPKIKKIRKLIQTITSEAEQPRSNPYPEEFVSRGISIPNLKVKGIIFFSSSSPSNHIFVSTLESKNRKARVGDTIQSATLMHIESNRVVFTYKGETVHLRIGE